MTPDVLHRNGHVAPRQVDGAWAEPSRVRMGELAPLYYALTFATGLTPDALEPPVVVEYPEIRPIARPLLSGLDLATILEQPIVSIGRGTVTLAEVDRRLGGLVVSLGVYQMVAGGRALIGIGVVRQDRMVTGGASAADLWELTRTALAQRPVMRVYPGITGRDAFMAVHRRVAQVAWLRGDRLLTVSVTCVEGHHLWMIRAARSVAALVDDHIGAEGDLDPPIPA